LGLVVVVMVGLVLDGRTRGPGARALAEDLAGSLASEGIQTHLIELVPTPVSAPRLLHSIRRPDAWLRRDHEPRSTPSPAAPEADLDGTAPDQVAQLLAAQVAHLVEREAIGSLHAIGIGLAGRVVQLVHEQCGTPYFVTPRARDIRRAEAATVERGRDVLRSARHVLLLDEQLRADFETTFATRPGESAPRLRLVRRGVDLDQFKPVPRLERARAAANLDANPVLATRLQDIDWERGCIVLCLQPTGDVDGFAQFLFALPEVLRQQPAVQVVVVASGPESAAVDSLRAALAAGRPELLVDVLQTSEMYQPLLDHLGRLHAEGRTPSWWSMAARLEPERRVRYTGSLARDEFARLLALADVFVIPGNAPHAASHVLYEALACGVLALASESAGIGPLARLVAEEISAEIASLCVLRADAPAVHELEEKLGRLVRLRPEISDRLRTLAVRKFDGRQTASDLRRLYGEPARIAALRV
jgi:glycosyltransferase involved in cell wall biosynthesis